MPAITNSSVVLPVEYSREIQKGIIGRSKALELGKRLPDMIGKNFKLNVMQHLPIAGWVKNQTTPAGAPDEIKHKPLSVLAWEGVDLVAEEISVIVPVSINTLRDVENYVDIVPQINEEVIAAFDQVIDSTLLFGTNSPWSNYSGIVAGATSAGAVVQWNGQGGRSFYDAISAAMEYVEKSGFMPDAILGAPSINAAFRGSITDLGVNVADQGEVGALARHVDFTGGFDSSSAFAIVGDFKRGLVYAFRQEMEVRLLEEATLYDAATSTTYYLAQQDMVAFRFTMRLGAALPNPVTRVSGVLSSDGKYLEKGTSAYPFAVITKSGASA